MTNYPVFTTPERRNLSMQDARLQANDELGSLYERALQNMQTSVAEVKRKQQNKQLQEGWEARVYHKMR
ncbi:hypothetical protein BTCBT_004238 [Bacillus thuringiensis T01-328]|uniref:Uncharacterized protein n=1 Tax=Bacillus thuringiensis T01-328 TaxID=1324966 RepID=A0AAN4HH90_BACTU|nr:hypothetical protein BTCBT_004238 [Bacillus thuringiensis T01-328]